MQNEILFSKITVRILLFQYKREWVPVAWALMQRKSKAAYEFIFNNLRSKWDQLSLKPKFSRLLTDFEEAEMAAAQEVFGSHKVHFSWCILLLKLSVILL